MKMVKSLLLGSAAGLVAVAGAQAADLPVKAKAADPVRICSLYGKGFYYIPGSDMCLSITGFTRFQIYGGTGNGQFTAGSAIAPGGVSSGLNAWSNTNTPFSSNNGMEVRSGFQNDLTYRTRVMLTLDARQQTAYGTLRSVVTAGYTSDIASAASQQVIYANRGFIQIAGFTLGKAVSFYDLYSSPAYTYFAVPSSDTGDGGQMVAGYTFQFGGGVSATIAAEEARRNNLINANLLAAGATTSYAAGVDNVQYRYPDIVGALRWDQAWGAFQIMGALHDASGGYYANTTGLASAFTAAQNNGHPGDKWGFAIGTGLKLNIGADVLDTQFNYTEGATKYLSTGVTPGGLFVASSGAPAGATGGGSFAYGLVQDGIFATPGTTSGTLVASGGINLTTAWGFNAAYDHRWSPALKTSVYGGYMSWKFNAEATAIMCGVGGAAATGLSAATSASGVCSQDWQQWFIGSRTQWDVARSFYVGVDVLYSKLQTANAGGTTGAGFSPNATVRPAGVYNIADKDAWAFTFRAHRDIVP